MKPGSRTGFVHEVDYISEDGNPVIRVFGRTEDDNSFVSLCTEFKPYFYCLPGPGYSSKQLLKRILSPEVSMPAHVIEASLEKKMRLGDEITLVRVTLDSPREVRSSRSLLRQIPAVEEIFEKDILFKRRFIIDTGINPLGAVVLGNKTVTNRWPVDIVYENGVPECREEYLHASDLRVLALDIEVACRAGLPNPQLDPIIMIGLADSKGTRILSYGRSGGDIEICESEGDMIRRFSTIVREGDYDLLLGYNSDSFDLPYLRTRARKNGLRLCLGRDLSELTYQPGSVMGRSIIRGRINIDLYPPVRRMLNLPTYKLSEVYSHLSGREKEELEVGEIRDLWSSGREEDAVSIARYCASDVEATMYIAMEVLPTLIELSKHTKQLLADVARMGQSQMVEWLLIREAHGRGELVPNKPTRTELSRRRRETYEGGYVLEPRKGLQENIVALDFRSLYPTIIVTHNVDISTLDCDCCPEDNVSPTGHHFCRRQEGFIPSILGRLVDRRKEIKVELAEVDPGSPELTRLNAMQSALKILSNSFYGYSGYPQARWYSKESAESVAAWGREYIKMAIAEAEAEGFQVIYSDTDSVFMTIQGAVGTELVVRAMEFLRRINSSLPGDIELEYQGFSPRGFFVSKKRYALISEDGRITTKGLEVVRRDWSRIAKETQRSVLRSILEDGDPSRAAEEVRQAIRRVSERSVPVEDLVISTRMTKTLQSYDADAPHVALAKRLKESGEEIRKGSNIEYVVRKGSGRVGDRAQSVSEARKKDYDIDYYIENQILPPSMRILSSFGYREEDLRYYKTKQSTLDGF